jgi:type II secretory pathway predicted ATPase ExeA
MESTIWFTDGFVVVTGEIGSGKTTIIETFLKELDPDVVVAQINQTQISPIEFLQTLLVQFGFSPFRMRKAELLATLNQFLIEQYASGRRVVLVVDEAQNLSNKVLEEVRLLSGVETTKEKVLRIILAGQPQLHDKLDSPGLAQLKQRVRLRFHLTALSEPDVTEYIRHRLRVAGAGDREIFEPGTYPLIYSYAGGIPRLTNTLCDTAMLAAFAQDHPTVSVEDVRSAIDELQWVEYSARTFTQLRAAVDDTSPQVQLVPGRLVLSFRGKKLSECPIGMGRCIIGRTSDNDLQIDSTYISRHHAQVVCTADGVWIEDLNSTNGIFSGGKRIRRRRLEDGDSVKLGLHEITYYRDAHDTVSTGNLNGKDEQDSGDLSEDDDEAENVEAEERLDG